MSDDGGIFCEIDRVTPELAVLCEAYLRLRAREAPRENTARAILSIAREIVAAADRDVVCPMPADTARNA